MPGLGGRRRRGSSLRHAEIIEDCSVPEDPVLNGGSGDEREEEEAAAAAAAAAAEEVAEDEMALSDGDEDHHPIGHLSPVTPRAALAAGAYRAHHSAGADDIALDEMGEPRKLTSSEKRVNVRKINDIVVAVANSLQSRRQMQRKERNAVVLGSDTCYEVQ